MTDQQDAGPQIRPLGVGALLDAAIKLVRQNFKALAIVTLIVAVPIAIASGLITVFTTDFCRGEGCIRGEFETDTVFVYEDDLAYYGGQVVNAVLTVLELVLVQVACFRILAEGYLGRSIGWRESLRFAFSRGRSSLWLITLYFTGIVIGFLLLIVPGVWLTIAWSVAIPVLLVEGERGRAALSRSAALVKGFWWPTAGKILVSTLLVGVAAGAIAGAFAVLLLFVVDEASYAGVVVSSVGSVLGDVVTTPFSAAVTTLVYFDLRVRREGFDLAMLAERMGGAPATSAAVATRGTPEPAGSVASGGWSAPAREAGPGGWSAPAREAAPGGWSPPAREAGAGGWAPPAREGGTGSWTPPVREPEPAEPVDWSAPAASGDAPAPAERAPAPSFAKDPDDGAPAPPSLAKEPDDGAPAPPPLAKEPDAGASAPPSLAKAPDAGASAPPSLAKAPADDEPLPELAPLPPLPDDDDGLGGFAPPSPGGPRDP